MSSPRRWPGRNGAGDHVAAQGGPQQHIPPAHTSAGPRLSTAAGTLAAAVVRGLAGRSDTLFSADAAALIHQTSRGYPRAGNDLALQALVAAFAADKAIVDESSTRAAVAEVTTE